MPLFRRPRRVIGPPVPPPTRKPEDVPAVVVAGLGRGETVLATAQEDAGGHWLVLTPWRVLERTESGQTLLDRPWHEVDGGTWDPDAWVLSLTFVDRLDARQWGLQRRTGPGQVPAVLRERTSASVVLMREVDLGARRSARVAVRADLRTRELLEQVLLDRGARRDDEALMAQVHLARQELRGQVGLDPVRD